MEIGKTIKLIRDKRNISQWELATASGISAAYLSLLESGQRTNLSIENLGHIAEALNVPISLLVFLASDEDDIEGMDQDLFNDLSAATLKLIGQSPEVAE